MDNCWAGCGLEMILLRYITNPHRILKIELRIVNVHLLYQLFKLDVKTNHFTKLRKYKAE